MKTRILFLAVMCFCVTAMSVKASPFLGDDLLTATPQTGKKMNFQGTLYENGEAVTGERSFTFSIDLGDGEVWTETHPNVQVVEGLYAVLLGSIDPMPTDLFFDVEERDLTISVGNTVLGTTQLLAPFGLNNGENFKTAEFNLIVESDADTATVVSRISGLGLTANRPANAIFASATTDSTNTTVLAEAIGSADNISFQTALRGEATNNGPSWATGVWGRGFGYGGGTTYGIRGEAYGEGNGFSAAARGLNFVESTDAPISRYGALFDTRFGFGGEASVLGTSYGVAGVARGSEINYGVYGSASGLEGSLNFAGFFQGDVKVTNSLFVTTEEGFGSELSNFSVMHRGNDTEVNAMLGSNWIDGGSNPENRGALFLFADTLERFNRGGADIRRVELRVRGDGYGGSTGALSLRSYNGEKLFAGIETFDGENYFSTLRLDGANSNNFNFTASDYPNGDAARMTMSGGLAKVDENGNSYVPEILSLSIDQMDDGLGNVEERANLQLNSTSSAGLTTLNTEELTFRSNDFTKNYFSLGARNNGEGGRNGFLSMQGNFEHSDGEGNTYIPTLFDLNIFKNSEESEQAFLSLRNTEGGTVDLNPNGLSLNQPEYQVFDVSSFDNGANGRNVNLTMTSSLLTDDGAGNSFRRQLVNLGVGYGGENQQEANFRLGHTNGDVTQLNSRSLSFLNGEGDEAIGLSAFGNGINGRITPLFTMQSGLDISDEFGNTFHPELVRLAIQNQDEDTDFSSLSLGDTDGRDVNLNRNGLNFHADGYTPFTLNVSEDGGTLSAFMAIKGGIQRMDEGQDFSFNPELVTLGGEKVSESNEVGRLTLSDTEGNSFGINAYGFMGLTQGLQTRSMGMVAANDQEVLNMSTNNDGQGNELAVIRIRDVSNDFADLARIESVNETDIFGRLVLDKRNSATDQFRIDANGVFGGTDVFQNGLALNYDGTGGAFLQMYANGNQNVLIDGSTGNMTLAGSLSQSSDARLKKNVETLSSGLAMVNQLRGVRYNWKDETRTGNKVGFIAQEVEDVLPELVVTKKDGFKAVNYAEMTAVLVEAVKELSREIAELKKENSTLKAELTKADELESRLAKIEAMLAMDDSKETVKAGQK